MSLTTLGEGPWYCRRHFARLNGWDEREALVTVDEQTPDEMAHQYVPRHPGEADKDWVVRCRAWVLRQCEAGFSGVKKVVKPGPVSTPVTEEMHRKIRETLDSRKPKGQSGNAST